MVFCSLKLCWLFLFCSVCVCFSSVVGSQLSSSGASECLESCWQFLLIKSNHCNSSTALRVYDYIIDCVFDYWLRVWLHTLCVQTTSSPEQLSDQAGDWRGLYSIQFELRLGHKVTLTSLWPHTLCPLFWTTVWDCFKQNLIIRYTLFAGLCMLILCLHHTNCLPSGNKLRLAATQMWLHSSHILSEHVSVFLFFESIIVPFKYRCEGILLTMGPLEQCQH